MENIEIRTQLPELRGKKLEEQENIITITITSLEEEINSDEEIIKSKKKVLNEWYKKLENLNSRLKESAREKHYKGLLELSTPEQRELLEKIYKKDKPEKKKKKK